MPYATEGGETSHLLSRPGGLIHGKRHLEAACFTLGRTVRMVST